jgi:co-chaperonin GroES (HSP10)
MEAVGRRLIIEKIKEGTTSTKGGLLLSEKNKEDIRYVEALVISVGEEVLKIKKGDRIFYDKNAGHKLAHENYTYHVIKLDDVVVIL